MKSRIDSNHPDAILNRGYAIVEKKNREFVRSISQLEQKNHLTVYLRDGSFDGTIQDIREGDTIHRRGAEEEK